MVENRLNNQAPISRLKKACLIPLALTVGVGCGPLAQAPKPDSSVKVYGGTPVAPGEAPQVVALLAQALGDGPAVLRCTGTMLTEQIALTAGHCLHEESNPSPPPVDPEGRWLNTEETLWVYQGPGEEGGVFDLSEAVLKGQAVRAVRFKIFPTLWVDPLSHGDLGLLELEKPFLLAPDSMLPTPYVKTWADDLKIAPTRANKATTVLIGYGRREDGGLGVKYQAELTFQNRGSYAHHQGFDAVLGGQGRDSCDGDSGGPLFLKPLPTDNDSITSTAHTPPRDAPLLWGISSYGVSLECGPGAAYQGLFQARCWIQDALNQTTASLADPKTGQCRVPLEDDIPVAPDPTKNRETFRSICVSGYPSSTRATVDALALWLKLELPSSSNSRPEAFCAELAEGVFSASDLSLENAGVTDPRPLALLTHLKSLNLSGNNVDSAAFLAHLPNLTWLDITGNSIDDVTLPFNTSPDVDDQSRTKILRVVGASRQYQTIWQDPFLAFCEAEAADSPHEVPQSPETKLTIHAVKARTMAQSCHQAWRRVLMGKQLVLKGRHITDLRPLAGWSHLISLDLSGNPDLTDVSPLHGLESLRLLKLTGTQVRDLSALNYLVEHHKLKIVF